MSFKAEEKKISEMLPNTEFIIPRNQRRYVWAKKHWQDLFDDLCSIVDNKDRSIPSHFIGSIVLQEHNKNGDVQSYTVIDGQQRITTIVIILAAIMKLLHERGSSDQYNGLKKFLQSKDINSRIIAVISSEYHQSIQRIIDKIANLTENDSQDQTSQFIRTLLISSAKDKVIGDCYVFYHSVIKKYIEQCDKPDEKLFYFRDALIDMNIVKIVSTSVEDSYTIFEILNARGQELDDYEIIPLVTYNNLILSLYKFFICYTIIGEEKSNRLMDIVNKYSRIFENGYTENSIDEFIHSLKERMPTYENFKLSFCNLGWSNHNQYLRDEKKQQKVKIVLGLIEEYSSNNDIVSEFAIEHILNDSDDIANSKIGNLIPLETRLNERCKNKRFQEKLLIYKESSFRCARAISERYLDKQFEIDSRSNHLAKLLYDSVLSF
ncbi:MAG: DUF262 domain-containing protein [Rikenellaceae bacterium]